MLAFGMVGDGVAVRPILLVILAEQTVRVPPPLAEPLHWLISTVWPADWVPVAVQVSEAPPPLPEPLHWVIVAPVVVAGNGLQIISVPVVTEPTHWFTVTAVTAGLRPTKLFVTTTLHRSVPPPPLIEPSHCVTAVTGSLSGVVVFVHVASGTPAEPVHSRTVTTADPPVGVIVLTTVTSQTAPPFPSALLHVVVGAIVTADAGAAVERDAAVSSANANEAVIRKEIGRRIAPPVLSSFGANGFGDGARAKSTCARDLFMSTGLFGGHPPARAAGRNYPAHATAPPAPAG